MIGPSEIVAHLRAYLPAATSLFSEAITGTASAAGNQVTVTAASHGLLAGQKIFVGRGIFKNPIVSATDNGDGTVRFETQYEHDLTEPKAHLDPDALEMAGFNEPVWNGAFNIFAIPNRKTFEIEFPQGETNLPTGSGFLLEDRPAGIVGAHTIVSVPDTNTIIFDAPLVPSFPTGELVEFTAVKAVHVYAAINIDRAVAAYAKLFTTGTAKPVVFVIMGDADVSKDRHTSNDGIGGFTRGNVGKQTILQDFSTVVFFPTENDITGAKAQTLAYKDVYKALASVLYGFIFNDLDSGQKYTCVNNGHGPGIYNSSYYTHVYEWQVPTVVLFENNGWGLQPDVAFRDIESKWKIRPEDIDGLQLDIDLDEEPIV